MLLGLWGLGFCSSLLPWCVNLLVVFFGGGGGGGRGGEGEGDCAKPDEARIAS